VKVSSNAKASEKGIPLNKSCTPVDMPLPLRQTALNYIMSLVRECIQASRQLLSIASMQNRQFGTKSPNIPQI
jgi:hypothetical protein